MLTSLSTLQESISCALWLRQFIKFSLPDSDNNVCTGDTHLPPALQLPACAPVACSQLPRAPCAAPPSLSLSLCLRFYVAFQVELQTAERFCKQLENRRQYSGTKAHTELHIQWETLTHLQRIPYSAFAFVQLLKTAVTVLPLLSTVPACSPCLPLPASYSSPCL